MSISSEDQRGAVGEAGALVPAACPVCGPLPPAMPADPVLFEAVDHLFGVAGRFSEVRCRRCGTLRVDPRPAAHALGRYYAKYYTPEGLRLSEALQVGTGNPGFDPLAATLVARWRQILALRGEPAGRLEPDAAGAVEPLVLLDVGCGLGGFLHHVRRADRRVQPLGVENAVPAVAFARDRLGLDVVRGCAEKLPLPAGCVDVLTLWHVLEHSPDPGGVLAEAWRVLRPGGVLALEVPQGGGLLRRLFGPRWFFLQAPTHFTLFSVGGLRTLLRRAGFTVERTRFPPTPLEFLGSLLLTVLRPAGLRHNAHPNPWIVLLVLGLVALELPLLGLLGLLRRGGVVRLLAKKSGTLDESPPPVVP